MSSLDWRGNAKHRDAWSSERGELWFPNPETWRDLHHPLSLPHSVGRVWQTRRYTCDRRCLSPQNSLALLWDWTIWSHLSCPQNIMDRQREMGKQAQRRGAARAVHFNKLFPVSKSPKSSSWAQRGGPGDGLDKELWPVDPYWILNLKRFKLHREWESWLYLESVNWAMCLWKLESRSHSFICMAPEDTRVRFFELSKMVI